MNGMLHYKRVTEVVYLQVLRSEMLKFRVLDEQPTECYLGVNVILNSETDHWNSYTSYMYGPTCLEKQECKS
jgi:hypothetical protein